jgi:hypothetical protein
MEKAKFFCIKRKKFCLGNGTGHAAKTIALALEEEIIMAKYGRTASKKVRSTMRKRKKGTLKSGSGKKVKSRKQAIAIGLSEARRAGGKVPPNKSSKKRKKSKKK